MGSCHGGKLSRLCKFIYGTFVVELFSSSGFYQSQFHSHVTHNHFHYVHHLTRTLQF
jgi:hypothetical protein